MPKNLKIFIILGVVVLLVILIVFLLPSKGYGKEYNGFALLVPTQRAVEQTDTAVLAAVVYFCVLFIQTIFFILAKITLIFSNDFNKTLFFPFRKPRKRGKYRLRGIAEADGVPLAYAKVILFDEFEHHLDFTYTDRTGQFNFFAPQGTYVLEADKFGFEFEATKPIILNKKDAKNIELPAKKTEDAIIAPPLLSCLKTSQIVWLGVVLSGFICGWFVLPYLGSARAALVFAGTIVSLAIYLLNNHTYLLFCDKKGRVMANSEFEISDHKGTKIVAVKTDKSGKVRLIAAPGFYKVTSDKTLTRTFKVSAKEIVDLELKV